MMETCQDSQDSGRTLVLGQYGPREPGSCEEPDWLKDISVLWQTMATHFLQDIARCMNTSVEDLLE